MSDDWNTPEWVMSMFATFHDPCPPSGQRNRLPDAFSYDWLEHHDQVYVNPPYSDPLPWVKKAVKEISIYDNSTIVLLLKHDSSTEWFRILHEAGARFLMFNRRLKFISQKGEDSRPCSFPSILAVLHSPCRNQKITEWCNDES